MKDIENRVKHIRKFVSSLKESRKESRISTDSDVIKLESKKYNPENAETAFHIMLETIKKSTLEYKSQIEIIQNITPTVANHLEELLKEFEEERLRINNMLKGEFLKKIKSFDLKALEELDKTEENMQYIFSIEDHLNEIIVTVYNSLEDTLNFVENENEK